MGEGRGKERVGEGISGLVRLSLRVAIAAELCTPRASGESSARHGRDGGEDHRAVCFSRHSEGQKSGISDGTVTR